MTTVVPAPADYPGCPVTVTEAIAAGRELRPPRWGLWDVFWALMAAIFIGVGVGAVLYLTGAPIAVEVLFGTTAPWLAFAGWPIITTRWRGNGPVIDLGPQPDVARGRVGRSSAVWPRS